jgi:hypothetical protein
MEGEVMTKAQRIKNLYEVQWLAQKNVVSVSTEQKKDGAELIVIGVVDKRDASVNKLPRRVKGVPIVIEETRGLKMAASGARSR